MSLVAAVVPIIKEHTQKICNTAASIVLVKNATVVSLKTPTSSQIHSLPTTSTKFQAHTLPLKMVSAKKISGTLPTFEF